MQPVGVKVDVSNNAWTKYHISLLLNSSVFSCPPSTMPQRLNCGVYWSRVQEAPLYTKCLFLWQHLNAAQDEMGDLCRDAESWRRASDEISWGNNNRKGGGSDQENLYASYVHISLQRASVLHQNSVLSALQQRVATCWGPRDAGLKRRGGNKRRRMWQGRGPPRRPQLYALLDKQRDHRDNLCILRASLSGLRDRLIH